MGQPPDSCGYTGMRRQRQRYDIAVNLVQRSEGMQQ
jgi:hypothetical protein